MPLILSIDTATEIASVCLSKDSNILSLRENHIQKDHAGFVNVAIDELFADAKLTLKDIDAVAVTSGPGSYTGLRVGLATAKGLCYALQKPLITLNTLHVMTTAAIAATHNDEVDLYCPMIDARRMEVFTGLFTATLAEVLPPMAMELNHNSFDTYIVLNKILYFGNGSTKFQPLITKNNASFLTIQHNATHLVSLAEQSFTTERFTDIAYSEPNYLKAFFSSSLTPPVLKNM